MILKNFEVVKNIILDLEDGKIDHKSAIHQIKLLTDKEVTEYELAHYWRSCDLQEFARTLAMPEIENWSEIDEARALLLIAEILNCNGDAALINRNAGALEKRYKKSSGTVIDLIYNSGLHYEQEILAALKNDTTMRL
ncbi:MAG: hypothetical protein HKP49_07500 [Maribacter sp.]|nr:hypothetical protein [Maribacter sp.]